MEDKIFLKKAKNILNSSKIDPSSVLFLEEKINKTLLKNWEKLKYAKDTLFLKLILACDDELEDDEKIPTRADFIEKREIDSLTYSLV